MANHQSAKKRYRQSLKRRARNSGRRSRVHTAERQLKEAIAAKDTGTIKDQLLRTVTEIMRARTKGVLHRNTASRKVARLSRAAHRALTS